MSSDILDSAEQLVIQCPSCHTRFAVAQQALGGQDNPRFHCSRCDNLFHVDTSAFGEQSLAEEAAQEIPQEESLAEAAAEDLGTAQDHTEQAEQNRSEDNTQGHSEVVTHAEPEEFRQEMPEAEGLHAAQSEEVPVQQSFEQVPEVGDAESFEEEQESYEEEKQSYDEEESYQEEQVVYEEEAPYEEEEAAQTIVEQEPETPPLADSAYEERVVSSAPLVEAETETFIAESSNPLSELTEGMEAHYEEQETYEDEPSIEQAELNQQTGQSAQPEGGHTIVLESQDLAKVRELAREAIGVEELMNRVEDEKQEDEDRLSKEEVQRAIAAAEENLAKNPRNPIGVTADGQPLSSSLTSGEESEQMQASEEESTPAAPGWGEEDPGWEPGESIQRDDQDSDSHWLKEESEGDEATEFHSEEEDELLQNEEEPIAEDSNDQAYFEQPTQGEELVAHADEHVQQPEEEDSYLDEATPVQEEEEQEELVAEPTEPSGEEWQASSDEDQPGDDEDESFEDDEYSQTIDSVATFRESQLEEEEDQAEQIASAPIEEESFTDEQEEESVEQGTEDYSEPEEEQDDLHAEECQEEADEVETTIVESPVDLELMRAQEKFHAEELSTLANPAGSPDSEEEDPFQQEVVEGPSEQAQEETPQGEPSQESFFFSESLSAQAAEIAGEEYEGPSKREDTPSKKSSGSVKGVSLEKLTDSNSISDTDEDMDPKLNPSVADQALRHTQPGRSNHPLFVFFLPMLCFSLLLGLGGYVWKGPSLVAETLANAIMVELPQPAPAELSVRSPKLKRVDLRDGQIGYRLSGKLQNDSPQHFRNVIVEGIVYSANGDVLGAERVSAGGAITRATLRELSPENVRTLQAMRGVYELKPGESKSFSVIVFPQDGTPSAKFYAARVYSVLEES